MASQRVDGEPAEGAPDAALGQRRRDGGPFAARRAAVRGKPGGALLLKVVAGVVGAALVALGGVLIVLPGPLTIPPVLAGLYVLSLEFTWADRLFLRARASGEQAWAAAKQKPVTSALVTGGGLVLAGAAFWAVRHFHLVAKARDAVGL